MSKRLIDVISHAHIAVATFDSFGQCTFCSPVLIGLLYSKPLDMDQFVTSISPREETRHQVNELIDSVKNGQMRPGIEVLKQDADGVERTYFLDALLLGNERDAELAVIVHDPFGQAPPRRDLEQIGRLATLGQITAGVAHEFNNILTSILGWTQIARQSASAGTANLSALEIIEGNARRAKDIASRLLGILRPSLQSNKPISLIAVIEDVLKLLSWEMSQTDIQVVRLFECDDLFLGDENRIGQVLINVIRNAMDAMSDGGTINITVRRKGATIEASITDSGKGIEPKILSQIFDPFFTTKRQNDKQTHGGSGLGLSICRDILTEHQGTITVESLPGRGTRFRIALPIAQPASAASEEESSTRSTIPPGTNILVADDEPDIGEMIRTSLELKGANVIAVKSGEEAARLCEEQSFDVAFVDFSMPGLSGHRLGHRILALQPDIRLIYMSGRDVEIDKDMPVADFLKKPFDLTDVQNKLCQVITAPQIS